jgi:hypothetical protein
VSRSRRLSLKLAEVGWIRLRLGEGTRGESSGLPRPKPQVPARALQPRAYSYVPLPISFQLAPRAEITRAGENRQRRRSAYLQACRPQPAGNPSQNRHATRLVVGVPSRARGRAQEATDTVASEFVARMSVSEIRGCPACRHSALKTRVNALMAHAGYAVLARE